MIFGKESTGIYCDFDRDVEDDASIWARMKGVLISLMNDIGESLLARELRATSDDDISEDLFDRCKSVLQRNTEQDLVWEIDFGSVVLTESGHRR